MARPAYQLAAAAYASGDESLADAALVLARRRPRDRRAVALAALSKGGGVPIGYSLLVDARGVAMADAKGQTILMRVA